MEDVAQALVDGLIIESTYGVVTLRHQYVGDLVITSGALVACDPQVIEEDTIWPFVERLVPGQYPVILSIAYFADDGDQRVAYATLLAREQRPVRWEVARFSRDTARSAPEQEIPVYGVDSGTGCFMDADAARVWAQRINTIADYGLAINAEMDKNGIDTCGWASVSVAPHMAANLIAFSTGTGDGGYASYIGYDANDTLVCFVTDFALLWRDE